MDDELVNNLRQLSRTPGGGGRHALARASALRTLERIERRRAELPPMPAGWYPEGCDDFAELDAGDSEWTRQHWYAAIGP